MAKMRVWESLSDTYRKRLLKGGVSKTQYEAGVNLQSARGHRATPEHPAEAIKKPGKFREYLDRRKARKPKTEGAGGGRGIRSWQDQVIEKKDRGFSDRFKYDLDNQIEFVRYGRKADDIPKPSVALLREAMEMSAERMEELASLANGDDSQYKEYRFFWYH